jgi:hypothetical protein
MSCKGATNTKGAYLATMIGGGGGTTTWMIGGAVVEDKEDEGLAGTE